MVEDERARKAIEMSEAFADKRGKLKQAQLEAEAALAATPRDFLHVGHLIARGVSALVTRVIHRTVYHAPYNVMSAITHSHCPSGVWESEKARQLSLLRDIFNPFRQITLNPAALTPVMKSMAQAVYDKRILPSGELEPSRLEELANALSADGADCEIVGHLREPGPHVRGCWAVDMVLRKS
jgi:hypothetical protein